MGVRGVNEKALAARERKKQQALEKQLEAERIAEDKLWEDDDKLLARKRERKQAKELKALERQERKRERDAAEQLEAEEVSRLKASATASGPKKVTRAELMRRRLLEAAAKKEELAQQAEGVTQLVENRNHLMRAETFESALRGVQLIDVSNIDDALHELDAADASGKLGKLSFREFRDRELERLKAEFPTLKRSQILDRIAKAWAKSPENPANA